MSKGRRSSYVLPDTLEKLRIGRDGAVAVLAGTQPFNDRYKKAAAITQAIDDLVEDLTGNRELFWAQPHG